MSDDGFEVVETLTKANMPPKAVVSYLKPKRKTKDGDHRDNRKPSLLIYIPSKIMISKCENFLLMMDKKGRKLRVVGQTKESAGTVKCTSMVNAIRFNFGYVPYLGDEMAAAEDCKLTKITHDSYEVEMPPWFKPPK